MPHSRAGSLSRAAAWAVAAHVSLAGAACAQQLTAADVARLEPEQCSEGSSLFRTLTGALPFLSGASTRDMTIAQLTLVDQYKASRRRKVWVLRLPAAFIAEHTCDAARSNTVGSGDDLRVSQRDRLGAGLGGGRGPSP